MTKQRLDQLLVAQKLATTRSQAENLIRLGKVQVNDTVITKQGTFVDSTAKVTLDSDERYVSRAGLKLASVAKRLNLSFQDKLVLDVGSSTGGFTDYALQHGAKKVIAVDVGTEQMHPSLRSNRRVELHEKTDIRTVHLRDSNRFFTSFQSRAADASKGMASASPSTTAIAETPDVVVMDVSFISLREILPHVATLASKDTQIVAMLKPQFEAGRAQINKGVIKNDSIRRQIIKEFEQWAKPYFVIIDKKDSEVAGAKGNQERFYLLKIVA